MSDHYKEGLKKDKEKFEEYFRKSAVKTEQQKFLESLIQTDFSKNFRIADVACGGGTLTYHLASLFKNSDFTLIDYLDDALTIAKDLNRDNVRTNYYQDDIYVLTTQEDNRYDFVFCWQTLSWLEEPEKALKQLVRITKPGGVLYLSSLFNLEHDVDIYSRVFDLTRESGANKIPFHYNTYSSKSIKTWLEGTVGNVNFYKFVPSIDFAYDGRGIGTNTVNTAKNERLQISAGLLLNWAILQINK